MAGIERIVLIVEAPFSRRDFDRFGIEVLERNGFTVEVWNFAPFLRADAYHNVKAPDPSSWPGYRVFPDRREALKAIADMPDGCFFIPFMGYELGSAPVFRAISRKGLAYGLLRVNLLPTVPRYIPRRLSPKRLLNSLFIRAPGRLFGIRPPDLYFASGVKSLSRRPPFAAGTEVLWTHTLDYDHYLEGRGKPCPAGAPGGVFLDEYLPEHPDYVQLDIEPYTTAEQYYPALRVFFERLEKKCGAPIAIAAHPRSQYQDPRACFGERVCRAGATAELVRTASFVVAHASTAINHAVLFEKPIIFITTKALRASPEGPLIEMMARMLGKKPIDISRARDLDWDRELAVDKKAYAAYRRDYIKKPGSLEKPMWQIVADRLKGGC